MGKITGKTASWGAAFFALALAFVAAGAQAAPIQLTQVRTGTGFQSFTMDPTTGKYYRKSIYSFAGSLTEYANQADFEANVASGTDYLSPQAAGPYVTVNNGNLYAKTTYCCSSVPVATGVWDLGTGSQTAAAAQIGTVGGENAGFNWGGGSNGNFLQDSTGVYYLGSSTNNYSNIWELHKVDANLNSVASRTFDITGVPAYNNITPGFGFMIDGTLFLGATYNNDFITATLDFATGVVSTASFEVDGSWSGSYWNNAFYDPNADTLYMNNSSSSALYKVENASVAFGVGTPVPEPLPLGILALGIGALGFLRHRRHAVSETV